MILLKRETSALLVGLVFFISLTLLSQNHMNISLAFMRFEMGRNRSLSYDSYLSYMASKLYIAHFLVSRWLLLCFLLQWLLLLVKKLYDYDGWLTNLATFFLEMHVIPCRLFRGSSHDYQFLKLCRSAGHFTEKFK